MEVKLLFLMTRKELPNIARIANQRNSIRIINLISQDGNSQPLVCIRITGELVKTSNLGPTSKASESVGGHKARKSAFPSSSQVLLLQLPDQEPNFENYWNLVFICTDFRKATERHFQSVFWSRSFPC